MLRYRTRHRGFCLYAVFSVIDRNAPMCNNVLELASNPSTAFTETELHADPTYDYTDGLPDWLKRRIARQQKIAEVFKWYQDLHWGWKLGVGIGLLIGAITLTALSGGGWLGALGVVAQVALGVGVAVGLYSLGAAFGFYDFSLEGLGNVALEAFLASSAIVFVSSGVGFIKHLARGRTVSTAELAQTANQLQFESQTALEEHFARHHSQFNGLYDTPQQYLQGANYVINNGTYNSQLSGYVIFQPNKMVKIFSF